MSAQPPPPWIAELDHAQEVTLHGSADLEVWTARLAAEDLVPVPHGHRAQVSISAVSSRFRGIRFREAVVSVHVAGKPGSSLPAGLFLDQAWSTSRLFAWCERWLFRTPYAHGRVDVVTDAAPRLQVADGEARMLLTTPHAAGELTAESWRGPIYLPGRPRRAGGVFYALLAGPTRIRPLDPSTDRVEILPSARASALTRLRSSGFIGQTWAIRTDAKHARTKTLERSSVRS